MMPSKTKITVVAITFALLLLTLVVQATPYLIEHYIPGQYWAYLPEWVVASMGERPEFVPAVSADDVENLSASELVSVALPTSSPTAAPTATATTAATPTQAPAGVTVEPTLPPTETPLPPTPTSTPTPEPLPASARISDLDGTQNVAQEFNNCGPANLTVMLNYYGANTTQSTVASYLKPNNQDRNVSPWQISDYVNEEAGMGLKSITRVNGTKELLKRLIVAGFPVVIQKGYEPPETATSSGWYGHYLTVFGYDDEKQVFFTMDTFLGPFEEYDVEEGFTLADGHPYSYEYFDKYWQEFAYTYYVVYLPTEEAQLFALLGEETLDDQKMWQEAAQIAQAEIEQNQENAFAWFNLGTALTRLGEITGDPEGVYYANGAKAFDKAFSIGLPSRMMWYQHRPYIAYMKTGRYQDMLDLAESTLADPGGRNVEETYYYQGHALSFLGDLDGAATAFQQSLKLNEFFYPAQFALDYVNSIR